MTVMTTTILKNYGPDMAASILGGVMGGIIFGAVLSILGMMPMIARLAGGDSIITGWIVHLGISIAIGAPFIAWWRRSEARTLPRGILYGVLHGFLLWILGTLIIMPLLLGMGTQFGNMYATQNMMSFAGHVMYGFILGTVYVILIRLWQRKL